MRKVSTRSLSITVSTRRPLQCISAVFSRLLMPAAAAAAAAAARLALHAPAGSAGVGPLAQLVEHPLVLRVWQLLAVDAHLACAPEDLDHVGLVRLGPAAAV